MLRAWLLLAVSLNAQTLDQRIQQRLKTVDQMAARGPFQPNWESLVRFQAPAWYAGAKLGIFIHWGVYSVPAFGNEWYPRNMYLKDQPVFRHHVETYGPQSKFGYKDFIPGFKAEHFNAEAWAELFRNAGAKFVVPVAEHHDGFPMYDCSFTDWNAARMGPKRDIVGELEKAVRKQGLHFGVSSHRAEHWWFYDGGMTFDSDVKDPRYAGLYGPARPKRLPGAKEDNPPDKHYLDDWLARTTELIDKYQPEVLWFDWWIEQPVFQPYLQRMAAYYYNRGAEWRKGFAINYKNKSFPDHAAVLDIERGKLDAKRNLLWQTDTSISLKSWGYIENDEFRHPDSLIDDLVDIVSKNGVLLLNIGPRPDGVIPEQAQQTLLAMGKWLRQNGEAIYGSRPWKVYGEGPTHVLSGGFTDRKQMPFTAEDIRFTSKGGAVYAIALDWPRKSLAIHSLANEPVKSVELLGYSGKLAWRQDPDGLKIDMPASKPGDYAFAFRVTLR
ncbi:MAG: alpha-L-fucosidase [Bryobacterales bacterium]|nr:alpha-L-fucosidase [Bryobacterales bacterium]